MPKYVTIDSNLEDALVIPGPEVGESCVPLRNRKLSDFNVLGFGFLCTIFDLKDRICNTNNGVIQDTGELNTNNK